MRGLFLTLHNLYKVITSAEIPQHLFANKKKASFHNNFSVGGIGYHMI